MPRFDQRFVTFMWSKELEGKDVFYSDNINSLIEYVNKGDTNRLSIVLYSGHDDFPFHVNNNIWRFVYYDPNYATKLAAEQGKKIECKRKGDAWDDLDWDYTPDPKWLDGYEYRIKPDEPKKSKPVTNRELAQWLAQGNGEWTRDGSSMVYIDATYDKGKENETISSEIRIRKWEDEEWHEPTREYMGLED